MITGTERTNNTVYTNNTNKPIIVNIVSNGDGSGSWAGSFYVNNLLVAGMTSTSGYGQQKTVSVIVPVGSEYRYSYWGNNISTWVELR